MTEPQGRPAIRLPPQFAERARDVLDGTVPPVTSRDAATVMLLRQGAGGQSQGEPGLQVYMLRRRSSMAFAAGGVTCASTLPTATAIPSGRCVQAAARAVSEPARAPAEVH